MGENSLDGLIRAAFDHLIGDVRVALPGRIESFNADDRTVTVKPMISRVLQGAASAIELPVVQNVPLVEPRTAKAILGLPVASGDPVLMVFADRAIENWLGSSGVIPSMPLDVRTHELTDAFAILGGWPTAKAGVTPSNSAAASLQVEPGTPIYLGNGQSGVEVLELLFEFMDIFSAVTTGLMTTYQAHGHTSAGVDPPTDAGGWADALAALTLFQQKLDSLRA